MKKLKELRLAAKFTQKEVATMLYISSATYQNYEQGRAEPGIGMLSSLSKVFKTSIDELVGNPCRFEKGEELTPEQAECVKEIKKLDSRSCKLLLGMIGLIKNSNQSNSSNSKISNR